MSKEKRQSDWAEAKRRCRLSSEDVRMAKELGFSPRSLIKNIPSPQERWKVSVKYWIRDLYYKRQVKLAKRRGEPPPPDPLLQPQPRRERPRKVFYSWDEDTGVEDVFVPCEDRAATDFSDDELPF